jgi:hypothetical protein
MAPALLRGELESLLLNDQTRVHATKWEEEHGHCSRDADSDVPRPDPDRAGLEDSRRRQGGNDDHQQDRDAGPGREHGEAVERARMEEVDPRRSRVRARDGSKLAQEW